MSVIHILKDGSRVDDIKGHVIRLEDAELLYRFIHNVNQKKTVGKLETHDLGRDEIRI